MEELDSYGEYERVTVNVKVNHLDSPVVASGGKHA